MPIKTLFVLSDGSNRFLQFWIPHSPQPAGSTLILTFTTFVPIPQMQCVTLRLAGPTRRAQSSKKPNETLPKEPKKIRVIYDKCCAQNSIPIVQTAPSSGTVSVAWHETTGRVGAIVALHGRLADLIMVNRPINEFELPPTLEASLTETGRPVLVVAPSKARKNLATNIAIGWNLSVEAASAIADAMPFLAAADNVAVLTTDEGATATATPADVASHLAWHGVTARQYTFETGPQSVGEALLARVQKLNADLLVMGGLGPVRARTKEIALGDVTRHVLAHAEVPVLIGH